MKQVVESVNTYTKCLCPVCPVENGSSCIAAKGDRWREERLEVGEVLEQYAEHPETYEMEMGELEDSQIGQEHNFHKPAPADMRELFCSNAVGKSNCDDLAEASCQCPDCSVWQWHELKGTWYCMHGSQEVNG